VIDEMPEKSRVRGAVLDNLRAGQPVLSLGVRSARTADIARFARSAGYRVIWVDLEHSSMSIDCAAQILASAFDLGLEGWVRVPEKDYGVIGRLLDGGATGIIMPRVETAEEAARVVTAARFPPRGQRSQIARLPQFCFERLPAAELMESADRLTSVHILLETATGIANADAIAAVDGVDILHVGLNDLSGKYLAVYIPDQIFTQQLLRDNDRISVVKLSRKYISCEIHLLILSQSPREKIFLFSAL